LKQSPTRGRSEELRAIRVGLAASRCIELIGPPGAGATHLVERVTSALPGPVVTVTATVRSNTRPLGAVRLLVDAIAGPSAWPGLVPEVFGVDDTAQKIGDGLAVIARLVNRVLGQWQLDTTIVIDHSQHLDEASRSVVRGLASAIAGDSQKSRRLIVTGRTALLDGTVPQVELGPLAPEHARSIVTDSLKIPRSDADVDALVRSAAGIPGLAKALARLGTSDEMPPTYEAFISMELDRIGARNRRIIRELAVVGEGVDIDHASKVLQVRSAEVLTAIADGRGLVNADHGALTFTDEASRMVAGMGLPSARRRIIHGRMLHFGAADGSLSASELAGHAVAAGHQRSVLKWSVAAAERATGAGATSEATTHLANAVRSALLLDLADRQVFALAERWALSAQRAARPDEVDRALETAQRHAHRPADRVAIRVRQSRSARLAGDFKRAERLIRRAEAESGMNRRSLRMLVDIERAWLLTDLGNLSEALRLVEQVLNAQVTVTDSKIEFEAASLARLLLAAQGLRGAWAAGRRAVRAATATGDPQLLGIAIGNMAWMDDNRGRWTAAQAGHARAERAFEAAGDVLNVMGARINRASILVELGEVDRVVDGLPDAIRVFAAGGDRVGEALATVLWCRAVARRGGAPQFPELARRLKSAIRTVESTKIDELAAFQSIGEIEVFLLLREPHKAFVKARRLLPRVETFGANHLLPTMTRRLLAVAAWQKGHAAEADHWFEAATVQVDKSGIQSERLALATSLRARSRKAVTEDETDAARSMGFTSTAWFGPPHAGVSGRSGRRGR
jgi:tetratricopeptide (TPR) repeat protein